MINFDNYRKIKAAKLKVGDIVRIKSWASMSREFPKDEEGDIVVGTNYFTEDMKRFCKSYYRIGEIVYHNMRGGTLFKLKYDGLNPDEDLNGDLDFNEDWLGIDGSAYYFNDNMMVGLQPPKMAGLQKPKSGLNINKGIQLFDETLL